MRTIVAYCILLPLLATACGGTTVPLGDDYPYRSNADSTPTEALDSALNEGPTGSTSDSSTTPADERVPRPAPPAPESGQPAPAPPSNDAGSESPQSPNKPDAIAIEVGAPADDAGLPSIAGRTFVFWAEKELGQWSSARIGAPGPYPDSDYESITPEARYNITFSSKADAVEITNLSSGQKEFTGRPSQSPDGAYQFLLDDNWTGGSLLVRQSGSRITAELSRFGSGVYVTHSTRGELRP